MDVYSILNDVNCFATELLGVIDDTEQTTQSKQLYFLDNQEKIKTNMEMLKNIIENADVTDEAQKAIIDEATEISDKIKGAIMSFKNNLVAQNKSADEDNTPSLTEESIASAMMNNATTQEIAKRMDSIQTQADVDVAYNYMLVCDSVRTMISAKDKASLEANINAVVDSGNYKDIKLYQLQYTQVPLKVKTVLSV